MSAFEPDKDKIYLLEGWPVDVVPTKTKTGIYLRELGRDSEHQRFFSDDEILRLVSEGSLTSISKPSGFQSLGTLPEREDAFASHRLQWQQEAYRRLDYVQACDKAFQAPLSDGRPTKTPAGFKRIAEEVAAARLQQACAAGRKIALETVGGSTLREWYRRWVQSDRDVGSLLPAHHMKGREEESGQGRRQLHPEIQEAIKRGVEAYWLNPVRTKVTTTWDLICHDIRERRRAGLIPADVPDPSVKAVQRYTRDCIPVRNAIQAREGKAWERAVHGPVRGKTSADHVLELVEVDHTPLDIVLVKWTEPDGKKVFGIPQFTALIDKASRMIVAFDLSFEAVSTQTILRTLSMAMRPKRIPKTIGGKWPVHGQIESLRADNGSAFTSGDFRAACHELGIDLQFAAPGSPQLKGTIERLFGEAARDFAQMKGRKFANPQERRNYKPRDETSLGLAAARDTILDWIVNVYHNRPHSELDYKTPLETWDKLVRDQAHSFHIPSNKRLAVHFGERFDVTISRGSVQAFNLVWRAPELEQIATPRGRHRTRYKARLSAQDVHRLYVFIDEQKAWVEAKTDEPELHDGLGLLDWFAMLALRRQRDPDGVEVARNALLAARRRIFDLSNIELQQQGLLIDLQEVLDHDRRTRLSKSARIQDLPAREISNVDSYLFEDEVDDLVDVTPAPVPAPDTIVKPLDHHDLVHAASSTTPFNAQGPLASDYE